MKDIFNMKFFKPPFIFLSLFLCSLLSAQEAQFEVNLSNEINSNKIENSNIKARVEKFTEEFIQPIMRGDAYDIEIRDIDTIENYQKKNPIICGIPESRFGFRGTFGSVLLLARSLSARCCPPPHVCPGRAANANAIANANANANENKKPMTITNRNRYRKEN